MGALDAYIPSWKEYGKPMGLVLKPIGTTSSLSEAALLSLAAQKDQFIKLYPVPFNAQLTVQYQLETAATVSAELVRLNGTESIPILAPTKQSAGDYTYTIPVNTALPEGLYIVRLNAGGTLHTRMLIKDIKN
jgi:hypothetical protein